MAVVLLLLVTPIIIMMGKRESWMLCLVYLPGVSCLFCGYSSQCHVVIVIFPNLYHLLFLGVIHANSDGFGESAHLLDLV